MDQIRREDQRLIKNKIFLYNEYFTTDSESIEIVFNALIARGHLKTFRSNFLKTPLSGKRVSGVLLYFYDIGLIDIISKDKNYLYKRIFDPADAEELRGQLSIEYNLNKFLEEEKEQRRYKPERTTKKQLLKTLYAYLRWKMKLHRPLRSKYFNPVADTDNPPVLHADCPLNRYHIVQTMQYGIEKGVIDVREKKMSVSDFTKLLEEKEMVATQEML